MQQSQNNKIILWVGAIVVCLGLGFAGGYFFGQSKNTNSNMANKSGMPQMGNQEMGSSNQFGGERGSGGPGGGNSGEITSMSDGSITITTSGGTTKTIYFDDSTTVTKTDSVSTSDLSVGQTVSVMGTSNSSSSNQTAKTIMIEESN